MLACGKTLNDSSLPQPPNHESSYPKARPSSSTKLILKIRNVQRMEPKPGNFKLWNTRLVNSYMELIFRLFPSLPTTFWGPKTNLFSVPSAPPAAMERTTGATSVISTVSEFQVINVSPGCISLARSGGTGRSRNGSMMTKTH